MGAQQQSTVEISLNNMNNKLSPSVLAGRIIDSTKRTTEWSSNGNHEITAYHKLIGSLIYRLRHYQGMDLDLLAERSSTDVDILFAIEHGKAPGWVVEQHIVSIGEALGIELTEAAELLSDM